LTFDTTLINLLILLLRPGSALLVQNRPRNRCGDCLERSINTRRLSVDNTDKTLKAPCTRSAEELQKFRSHSIMESSESSESGEASKRRRESLLASLNCINHQKRKRLREMKVFVLDNSLRESTVGQVVGHSLDDKFKILDEITKCGFYDQIIGAFSQLRRVDDAFCQKLAQRSTDARLHKYAFAEDSDTTVNGEMLFGQDHIPIGLQKMKKYKIPSAIIEVDVADESVDWEGKFPISKFMEMITFLLKWTHTNLVEPGDPPPRNMLNL
jgi:hypothetical protein